MLLNMIIENYPCPLPASIHPLLAIAPASNPNHPFSSSSFYRASTLLHLDPLSLPAAKGHSAQEGVLTLPLLKKAF